MALAGFVQRDRRIVQGRVVTRRLRGRLHDAQVAARDLRPPFLIKLDTHGFEMPILAGAEQTLEQTNVLVIEAYNFDIASSAVRFAELCARLEARGFRCVDLFDVMYRPADNALWQMDLIFIRADRPEFLSNAYA
jgi:hypothetical protein